MLKWLPVRLVVQAEASFNDLLSSLEFLQPPSGLVPPPAGSPAATTTAKGMPFGSPPPAQPQQAAALPSQQQAAAAAAGLAASVERLEAESGAVRGSLQRTRHAMDAVQASFEGEGSV